MEISEAQQILDEMLARKKSLLIQGIQALEEQKVLAVAMPPEGFKSTVEPEEVISFTNQVQNTIDKRRQLLSKLDQLSIKIINLKIHLDGNMTIVEVETASYDPHTTWSLGWSKFNPQDVSSHPVRDNQGHILGYEEKSKYSELAGIKKALHRALTKLVESVYEEKC